MKSEPNVVEQVATARALGLVASVTVSASPGPTSIRAPLPPPPAVVPVGLSSAEMWIGLLSLLVAVISLAVGLKKPNISTLGKTFLWVLEITTLVTGIFLLGWLGIVLFIVSSVIALAVTSVRMWMTLESSLTSAAIEGDLDVVEVKDLHKRLNRSHTAFKWLGPMKLGELIRLLAQRSRSPEEIASMSLPITMLLAAFGPLSMPEVTEKFDRLLRLTDTPAADAMKIADTLTRGTQVSAWGFMENLDALLAVYDPAAPEEA